MSHEDIDFLDIEEKITGVTRDRPSNELLLASEFNEIVDRINDTITLVNACANSIESRDIAQYSFFNQSVVVDVQNTTDYYEIPLAQAAPSPENIGFTKSGNVIQYTSPQERVFIVSAILSFTTGSNQSIRARVFSDGEPVEESTAQVTSGTAGRAQSITTRALVRMNGVNNISIRLRNVSSDSNITVTNLNVIIDPSGPGEIEI